jgi:hypothetical protein
MRPICGTAEAAGLFIGVPKRPVEDQSLDLVFGVGLHVWYKKSRKSRSPAANPRAGTFRSPTPEAADCEPNHRRRAHCKLRGPTYIAVIADELAFWYVDAAYANPDVEIS